ncbi:MAG: hypothetical protein PHW74_07000, partial [Desulfobacca sp.]|nr:hypothetical protein [Desulfobacca sp.]
MAASPSNAVYWEQGLPPRLEQKWRNFDLIIKLSVIVGLLVSLVVAVHIGSLDAFLNFFRYQTYARPLLGIGAAYTLAFLVLQLVNTVLWWRYKPYPLPS